MITENKGMFYRLQIFLIRCIICLSNLWENQCLNRCVLKRMVSIAHIHILSGKKVANMFWGNLLTGDKQCLWFATLCECSTSIHPPRYSQVIPYILHIEKGQNGQSPSMYDNQACKVLIRKNNDCRDNTFCI